MRAQTSIASFATSLALLTGPALAADKACKETHNAYDSLINPYVSQTDGGLGYRVPFSNCSSYSLQFGTNIMRETAQGYRPAPIETTKTSILNILGETGDIHVYKQSGKDAYGLGFWHWGIGGRFEERNWWVTTSVEFRITPKKANLTLQFTF